MQGLAGIEHFIDLAPQRKRHLHYTPANVISYSSATSFQP